MSLLLLIFFHDSNFTTPTPNLNTVYMNMYMHMYMNIYTYMYMNSRSRHDVTVDALQVDEAFLQATQASSANYALFEYIKAIQSSFGIDWPSVKWEDLRMPLYSGLGARLYLEWSVSDVTLV